MRRSAVLALAAVALACLPATSASAAPGQAVCQLTDPNLSNLTGLATTATGYAAVENGSQQVYLLDSKCKRVRTLRYNGTARSPQDVTVAADGTLWVADTGDSDPAAPRDRIALWKVPASGAKGTIYRFTYPGGAHYDSRAMLMAGGLPIFVTKVTNGPAVLYTPTTAPNPNGAAVPLKKVGEFTPKATGTSNLLGKAGNATVTGGATSPDGTKVVLRTYSDAYEWTVTGNDVAGAVTSGTPMITPLPDEAAGEAITFTRDGQFFLTASNTTIDTAHPSPIMRYTPQATTTPANAAGTTTEAGNTGGTADTRNWWDKLSLQQITYLVGAIGVIGLLMVVGGVVGIRRARSQRRLEALAYGGGRSSGTASVPPPTSPEPQSYDPYGDQYGEEYGSGYPPQEYRAPGGYAEEYDQRPAPRTGGGGGTYQGGVYGAPPRGGTTYGGTGRAAPPRPQTDRYPPGPDEYSDYGR